LEIEKQAFLAINDRKRIVETEQREASKLASKREGERYRIHFEASCCYDPKSTPRSYKDYA